MILRAGLVLLAGGAVAVASYHGLRDIDGHALFDSLQSLPLRALLAALVATAVSYAVLVVNDVSALHYARAEASLRSTVLASFCGYAVGNFIGIGALSGGAVRYRIYTAAGVSRGDVARITIYIAAAFGLGAAETIALGLAFRAERIAALFGLSEGLLRGGAALILAVTIAALAACAIERRTVRLGPVEVALPGSRLVLAQIGVTMIDIAAAAGTLWVLLPATGLDFPSFVVIYTAALCLGVASHAPGGIGVFDAAILYALGTQSSPSAVAAALVAYRAIYFVLPFGLAALLLALSEIRKAGDKLRVRIS